MGSNTAAVSKFMTIKGKLHVVNEVDIERYLEVDHDLAISQEMDEEVMDAIAITARTNAYYSVSHKSGSSLACRCADVGYQGYAVTLQNLHVDRAINNTRHMVLTYRGKPFPTAWTKDSAGKTGRLCDDLPKRCRSSTRSRCSLCGS